MSPPRFILVTSNLPWPTTQASDRFQLELAMALREVGEVRWVARSVGPQEEARRHLTDLGFDLRLDETFVARDPISRLMRRTRLQLSTTLRREPRVLGYSVTPTLLEKVDECLADWPDAIVVGAFWFMARAVARGKENRRVLVISDVEYHRAAEAKGLDSEGELPPEIERLRELEVEAFNSCNSLLCLTPVDIDLAELALSRLDVARRPNTGLWPASLPIPESRMPSPPIEAGKPSRLLCYGHWPSDFNRDGLLHFLRHDWPAMSTQLSPPPRLRVAGKNLSPRLENLLRASSAEVLGWVDDLEAELANSHAVIVPLQYAGGLRYRMLESMAMGRPVICTRVAARGSRATAGEHYLPADTPGAWVNAVRQISQFDRAEGLAARAYAFVRQNYGRDTLRQRLLEVLESTLGELPGMSDLDS